MLPLQLPPSTAPKRVLCIGAHCDDIEIGCGGTLLQWQEEAKIQVDWVILTGNAKRRAEATSGMRKLIRPAYRGQLMFGEFPDTRLPAHYGQLKDFFDDLRRKVDPDVVFCHERDDAHQDHRMTYEMTQGAFRNHVVLEYEIPKWDWNSATPNIYVSLSASVARRKISALMSVYGSQRNKDWFSEETFRALMRIRGIECRSPTSYAEGFTSRKTRLSLEAPR